jgi:hypothetical protein
MVSVILNAEKHIQYVNHCVSSPAFVSIDLNDMYAGYTNPTKSTNNLAPPINDRKPVNTTQATRKNAAAG